eukprot:TRINITY_DN14120_c0_g1_i1.p1 TRINITY_DN14120_c0_g1~~TRINITY_DN14120_c0_g1_i1.p1  ORF type:complete len:226 (+),score=62.22 TRINITY_DN14120_c0_g1_i1:88-765(+)
MSEELTDFDQELTKLIAEIRKGIDTLHKAPNRQEQVGYLNGRINRAKQVFQSYKVELRDIPKIDQGPWQNKAKEHQNSINDLVQDLSYAQEKAELMKQKKGEVKPKTTDEMTADEILDKGAKIQEGDLARLASINDTVNETEALADEMAIKLKEQTEQLGRVDEGVDTVAANLKQAEKQLRAFVRRMATDKLIMAFIVLIIIGIIVIIIVTAVKGKKTRLDGLSS